jgi:hypothetical protein
VSDAVQIALIASAGPTAIGLLGAYLSFLNGKKIEVIHKATNGNLSEQLRIALVSAQTLAAVDGSPANISLAEAAKEKYYAHINQTSNDSGTKS